MRSTISVCLARSAGLACLTLVASMFRPPVPVARTCRATEDSARGLRKTRMGSQAGFRAVPCPDQRASSGGNSNVPSSWRVMTYRSPCRVTRCSVGMTYPLKRASERSGQKLPVHVLMAIDADRHQVAEVVQATARRNRVKMVDLKGHPRLAAPFTLVGDGSEVLLPDSTPRIAPIPRSLVLAAFHPCPVTPEKKRRVGIPAGSGTARNGVPVLPLTLLGHVGIEGVTTDHAGHHNMARTLETLPGAVQPVRLLRVAWEGLLTTRAYPFGPVVRFPAPRVAEHLTPNVGRIAKLWSPAVQARDFYFRHWISPSTPCSRSWRSISGRIPVLRKL